MLSILITGSEVLDGRVLDTNSHYIIQRAQELGIEVENVLSCTDDIKKIKGCLEFLLNASDIVIISGGLGPTTDDVTTEAIGSFAQVSLELDQAALDALKLLYQQRNRSFDEANRKQAFFPKGSYIIKNPTGTAPGFWISPRKGKYLFTLPGVPSELKRMLDESVLPIIKKEILKSTSSPKIEYRVARIFGLAESVVGTKVADALRPKFTDVAVSYRAAFPEIQVKLKLTSEKQTLSHLNEAFSVAKDSIGNGYVFSESLDLSLEQVVHRLLISKQLTVAVAESCTGGLLGNHLIQEPGSSSYFLGGYLTYSNEAKQKLLQIPGELLQAKGAVSFEVAQSMASNVLNQFGADIGLAITGIAGPDGGSTEKPVGTFYVGCAQSASNVTAFKGFLSSSRRRIQQYATYMALDILRRKLQGVEIQLPSFTR